MIEPYVTVLDPQLMEQVRIITTGAIASGLVALVYLSPTIALLKILNGKTGNHLKQLGYKLMELNKT